MRSKLFLSCLIFTALFGLTPFVQAQVKADSVPKFSVSTIPEFWKQLDDIFEDPNFAMANWGVTIQSLSNGEYFYKRNENKLFIPASNLKLVTTASALSVLGKDYRFKTELYTRGKMDGSILKGDLIIRGFGDPTISGRLYDDDITRVFANWADSLITLGIDQISGKIIGDDDAFDDIGLGESWEWDYETDWYAAPSGALSLNDNCIDIFIKPTIFGDKAKLEIRPLTKYITIIQEVYTVPSDSMTDVYIYRERGTNIIRVTGTIRENDSPLHQYATVNNPTQYFVTVLKEVFQQRGIQIDGFSVDCDDLPEPIDYSKATKVITHYSEPLSYIIGVVNKNSQNFFAEQLLKVMGFEKEKFGSASNGLKVVKRFLSGAGINTDNLNIVDGSGLARTNLISPRAIVTLLAYMNKQESWQTYYNSLSVAGVDGTLRSRLKKTRGENNLHGKTGFLSSVRSLSGYIQTGDGELIALSIIANNFTVPVKLAENLQDLVCIRLANFKRK